VRCRIPHPLHPERHGQAVGDGRLDVLACEDAVQADECNEEQIEGELALDVDGVDDDLAGADLVQLAMVGVVGVTSGAREDGAEGGIGHGCKEDDAKAKRPGGDGGVPAVG